MIGFSRTNTTLHKDTYTNHIWSMVLNSI